MTPWTAAHQVSLSFTISWSLLKFTSIELAMLSNNFILCHLLLLLLSIFPSIRVFSSELPFISSGKSIRSVSFSNSSSNEYSRVISFRIDWFDLLAVQGTLSRVFSTTIQKLHFFGAQPSLWSNSHIHYY